MSEEVKAALLGVALGSLLTGGVSWLINKQSIKAAQQNGTDLLHKQEFIKAATNFRIAFLDILVICKKLPTGILGEKNIAEIITESLVGHEKSMLLFRSCLSSVNVFCFDQAWNDYSQQHKRNDFNIDPIQTEYATVFDIKKEIEKRHLVILNSCTHRCSLVRSFPFFPLPVLCIFFQFGLWNPKTCWYKFTTLHNFKFCYSGIRIFVRVFPVLPFNNFHPTAIHAQI